MLPRSIWFQNTPLPPSEPLTADVACDVAIIGGGIAGLAAAYELLPETKRVVVIEQGQIAGGSTGWSGGFLINAEGFDAKEMLDKWGPERGRELYDTNHAALERLASAITTENISCDFKKTGAYYVAAEKSHRGKVYEEYKALESFGLQTTWHEPGSPSGVGNLYGMLETFSDCAANPLRLALGLFSALKRKGVTIATDTHVKTVARTPGTAVLLTTATGHTVRAERVIVADNNWPAAHQLVPSSFRFRAVPVTSHIMITKPIPGIKARWGGQLMWDSYRIYHYLRLLDDGRILIGGEDKPIRQSPHGTMTDSRAPENQHLLHEIKKRFPGTAPEIDFGWSGRLSYPLDGLPVVMNAGPVTCCIADGLIQSWLAARMAVERITRGSSPLDWLYDSKRKFGPLNDLFLALPLPAFLKKRALLTGLVVEKIFDLADKWYIH